MPACRACKEKCPQQTFNFSFFSLVDLNMEVMISKILTATFTGSVIGNPSVISGKDKDQCAVLHDSPYVMNSV